MIIDKSRAHLAAALPAALVGDGFGPFFGTPCGVLADLYARLTKGPGLLTVSREDTAVGVAVGACLAGRQAVVLMQNSGLGQSVNALASLVVPYRIPLLLIVSMRGVDTDTTPENQVMGRLTEPLLAGLGIPGLRLEDSSDPGVIVSRLRDIVRSDRSPAALLVPPTVTGWRP